MPVIYFHREGPIAHVRLNRPEAKNAINREMLSEFERILKEVEKDKTVRVVLLSGEGEFFCAGGDLNWVRTFAGVSKKRSAAEAKGVSDLLTLVDRCPKVVIGLVHGAAIGGGVGLVSACDIVIAAERTIFALAEVKLGLAPSVISPFVLPKIGASAARRYFLTGERFDASVAGRLGLVHEVVPLANLAARGRAIAQTILSSGPEAVEVCKEIIRKVGGEVSAPLRRYTVETLARRWMSAEGQEGVRAFLEKRKPRWS